LSLLDATAAVPARLVRRATTPPPAGRRNRRNAGGGAPGRIHALPAATPACSRGVLRAAVPGADRADGQLQFLQPADDADVPVPVRRRGVAAVVAIPSRDVGATRRTTPGARGD